MRLRHSLLLLSAFIGLSTAVFAAEPPVDIVFDLDLTLVEEIQPKDPRYPLTLTGELPHLFFILGRPYQLLMGADALVDQIASLPNVRISFMSAGLKRRNLDLLRKLKSQRHGKSWYDLAYRVISREDLPSVEVQLNELRLKKDLRLINPDLDRVLLVDDVYSFILPEHQANELWLGETETLHAILTGRAEPDLLLLRKVADLLTHAVKEHKTKGRALRDTLDHLRSSWGATCNGRLRP